MLETRSPQPVWEAALGELQIRVNKPNYETWLKKTTAEYRSNHRWREDCDRAHCRDKDSGACCAAGGL